MVSLRLLPQDRSISIYRAGSTKPWISHKYRLPTLPSPDTRELSPNSVGLESDTTAAKPYPSPRDPSLGGILVHRNAIFPSSALARPCFQSSTVTNGEFAWVQARPQNELIGPN